MNFKIRTKLITPEPEIIKNENIESGQKLYCSYKKQYSVVHQILKVGMTESNNSNGLLIQIINPISKCNNKRPIIYTKLQLNLFSKKSSRIFYLFMSNFVYNFMHINVAMRFSGLVVIG